MSQRTRKRPVLAAALSFLQPGLGHLYLREWLRAILWAGLWIGSLGLVATTAGLEASAFEMFTAGGWLFEAVDQLPVGAILATVAVTAFATFDAYWLTRRNNDRLDGVSRCPHCGKELDPTLEFCHWCTTTLEREESA